MNEPKNIDLEMLAIAGMINDEECFYDGLSELGSDYFTSEENMKLFTILSEGTDMKSARILENSTDEVRLKQAVRVIDSLWTNKRDFHQAIESLKKIYVKRQLYHTIKRLENKFDATETDELMDELNDSVSRVDLDMTGDEVKDPYDFAIEQYELFLERYQNPDGDMGVPFSITNDRGVVRGLPSLDETFNGAQGGDLIMIAAKTGVGKSAFAVNLARIFSLYQNYPGQYHNTEMRDREIKARLIAPIAGIKANEYDSGRFEGTSDEIDRKLKGVAYATDLLGKSGLTLPRLPYLPLYKARGLAKQYKRKHDIRYLIVDYIGRMEMDDDKNLWDELYRLAKGLKQLAVELDIPIFMLAQRNEAGDVEGAKKMMNECDGVLFFEPITDDDRNHIEGNIRYDQQAKVNYRIVKRKVRRNDNTMPIYCMFDRSKSVIQEARRG